MKKFLIVFYFFSFLSIFAQSRDIEEPTLLENYAKETPNFNNTIRIDMQGLTLYELITTIADENQLNVSADLDLNDIVDSNFYDITIHQLFNFLIKRYSLEVERINGVLVFSREKEVPVVEEVISPPLDITYMRNEDLLSINLKNDSLQEVARILTDVSGRNVVLSPQVKDQLISSYILNRSFDQVLGMMASSNNLDLVIDENGFYVLSKKENEGVGDTALLNSAQRFPARARNSVAGNFSLTTDDSGFLNLEAYEVPATELIIEASEKLKTNFFMYERPDEVLVNITATGLTFEDLLNNIFEGKGFTYKIENGLYVIGRHHSRGLRNTQLIQLKNRSVETLLGSLPAAFLKELEIKEFLELNGFVVSGSNIQIEEFRKYIHEIDRVVPVIQIEVLIVQYQKGHEINTGIQIGLDGQERTTTGTFLPSGQVTLNSTSINDLIEAFNGIGWINLGKVTQDFYANLRAMENNSVIKISSTPKLVTLNGHEATSSIGETNYYFEQNNRLINSGINDNILQSGVWKSTEANLSVNIRPFVSQDEQITLKIRVEKNSFLGRAGENAPPGKATQSFESIVRVKNNEMVLLGGLDELERANSGSGTPILSRIPVIKWFFSNRVKKRQKSKLHLFIKPTVIY